MGGQFRENWKRLANKQPPLETPTAFDNKDIVRVEDLGALVFSLSGVVTTVGNIVDGAILVGSGSTWAQLFPSPSGFVLTSLGGGILIWQSGVAGGGGLGDVVGPSGATPNSIAVFDGSTGKLIAEVPVLIDQSGNMSVGGNTLISGDLTVLGDSNIGGTLTTQTIINSGNATFGGDVLISGDLTVLGNIVGFKQGVGVTVAENIPADYPSVNAALAANENILHMIGDTTEYASVNLPTSGLLLHFYNDSIWNVQSGNIIWTAATQVTLDGNGTLQFAYPAQDTLFDPAGFIDARVVARDITFDNNSADLAVFTSGTNSRLVSCRVEGDLVLAGVRNAVTQCDISSNFIVVSGAQNNLFSSSFLGGVIIDSGNGTLIADILTY